MNDLIATWRRNLRVIRLDPGHEPRVVDVEPLEVFSAFGRPTDSIVKHLHLGADTIIGTDVYTSGAFAVPSRNYPENEAATKLLALAGTVVDGFAIVGSVFLVGVDVDGRMLDTPPHVFDTLSRLGYRVPSEVRNTP